MLGEPLRGSSADGGGAVDWRMEFCSASIPGVVDRLGALLCFPPFNCGEFEAFRSGECPGVETRADIGEG
jgi:hypothetical protein